MQLNLNCVRDTLMTIEEWSVLNDDLEFVDIYLENICKSSKMLKYTKPDIAYTILILKEADFISAAIDHSSVGMDILYISRLTYSGHLFLDTIRPQAFWEKIHSIADKTGLKSLSVIMEIASLLLPDTLKSALHS